MADPLLVGGKKSDVGREQLMTPDNRPRRPGQTPNDDAPQTGTSPPRPQLSLRTVLAVAAIGGLTTTIAYFISGGSIPIFVAVMVGLGIIARLSARAWLWHIGKEPARGWWL